MSATRDTAGETMMIRQNLKQLRLPTIAAEYQKLGREAAEQDRSYGQYLLQLTELEVAARSANALRARIAQAQFPLIKELNGFDFTAVASLNKRQALELTQPAWLEARENACFIGSAGGVTWCYTSLPC
jgi:DNA replication protein DnaC